MTLHVGESTMPPAVSELLSSPAGPSVRAKPKRAAWEKWLAGIDGAEAGLAVVPAELDRAEMCRISEKLIASREIVGAFVVAMVWGYGSSGYGPYRTRAVLTGHRSPQGRSIEPNVVERLRESATIAREKGAVEGFRYLNNRNLGRIAYLGPAFFTKWLYAATARGVHDSREAAPVLDARVLGWVNHHTDLHLRPRLTEDYARYLAALTVWGTAAEPARTPVAVEEAIFDATAT
ncbi:MAG TPA: hypothetical protein VK024_07260 [Actinomycetaceae bacterium]|nr:hypothetical protein [Actinomycetaceae bacterium]